MGRKLIACLAMLCALALPSGNVLAKPEIYEGMGKYYMERDDDSIGHAKSEAKLIGKRNALEQAMVSIDSDSLAEGGYLTRDEVVAVAAGVIKVKEVKYSIAKTDDGVMFVTATVKAEIDADRLPELIERELKRRAASGEK